MPWNEKGQKTPGSGRPKGRKDNKTIEREKRLNDAIEAMSPEVRSHIQDIDALGLLQLVYRNGELPLTTRIDAAKTAIRYERAALSSVDVNATAKHADPSALTDEELAARIANAGNKAIGTQIIEGAVGNA